MQNKLQELTEKLYNEGLSKGKAEGEQLLARAQEEADGIVARAKDEAAAILTKAEKDAADLRQKVESDLRMASDQCLQATRKDLLVNEISLGKTEAALKDSGFIKEIILTVAKRFDAQQPEELALILPESMKEELEPWVKGELAKSLSKGVQAGFSKKIAGGFSIGPKDGGWFVSLSDETFRSLIAEYFRPVTRKLLFG